MAKQYKVDDCPHCGSKKIKVTEVGGMVTFRCKDCCCDWERPIDDVTPKLKQLYKRLFDGFFLYHNSPTTNAGKYVLAHDDGRVWGTCDSDEQGMMMALEWKEQDARLVKIKE